MSHAVSETPAISGERVSVWFIIVRNGECYALSDEERERERVVLRTFDKEEKQY